MVDLVGNGQGRTMGATWKRFGDILVITMDRVEKQNAIDRATSVDIETAMNMLEDDPGLRVGVITGGESVFSAGSDLTNELGATLMDRGGEYGVARRVRTKPLIAAVNGLAYGGGFELALACDVIVAASDARFALPEALRGVIASSGGLFRAPRALPVNIARGMLLTGIPVTAQRLYDLGVVNDLVEPSEVLKTAVELAKAMCNSSPASVSATLAALDQIVASHDQTFWEITERHLEALRNGPEAAEGIEAFFERRPPRWTESNAAIAAKMFMRSEPTARKWTKRFREEGPGGMADRSSWPHHSPTKSPPSVVRQIVRQRLRLRLGPVQIGDKLRLPASTVHAVLVGAGPTGCPTSTA